MKKLLTILLLFCGLKTFAQTANAGADVTIYLTQTSTATLNGSASIGTTFAWTDVTANIGYPMLMSLGVEGHPTNTGTITSSTSKTTTVTGLSQGTWYYQIASTTGATTVYDTTIVRVNYDTPPAGSALSRTLEISNNSLANFLNNRTDTTQMSTYYKSFSGNEGNTYYEMCRANGQYIDKLGGKFYATIEDGYYQNFGSGGTYARSEVSLGLGYTIDTTQTYCFEWKGYFPQDFSYLASNGRVTTIWQLHGNDGNSPPFEIDIVDSHGGSNTKEGTSGLKALYVVDTDYPAFDPTYPPHSHYLIDLADMVNKTHTIRVTLREGSGSDAFIKVEVDGVQKYYRNTARIGRTGVNASPDYTKISGVYDWGNDLVDITNHTRNRKFSLVTEGFNIYTLSDNPVVNAGNSISIYGNFKIKQ